MSENLMDQRISRLDAEVQALREKSSQQHDQHSTVMLALKEIQLNLAHQDESIKKMVHEIEGNGKAGLREEVRSLKQSNGFANRVMWAVSTILLAGVVTWAVEHKPSHPVDPQERGHVAEH